MAGASHGTSDAEVKKYAICARVDEERNRLKLIDEGRDTGLVAGMH